MTANIMMVTYNRLDLTKRTLNNLFDTTKYPFRLIIIDNNSTDGTKEYLKNLNPNCLSYNYHFNEQNLGIASGRNKALLIADQYNDQWLATIDNDVEFPTNWLNECIEIINANPNFNIGVNMEDVKYPIINQNGKTFQFKKDGNLGSACMVFHRKLHEKIGFFYGYENRYGEEDSDWGMRSRLAGYQLGYIQQPGNHFGVGDLDTGEYRKFKDECRSKNIAKFQQRCYAYMNKQIPIYVPFNELKCQ